MKTANVQNVTAEKAIIKSSHFNLNHDNNTTYSWGEVQPLLGKMMLPDSTINLKDEQLIRVAPMVVPTFGRVRIKNIVHFVPCAEIYPNWDAMLAQTKVSRTALSGGQPSASVYIPKNVPYVKNNLLAAFCLAGAKVNLYFSGIVGSAEENTWFNARNTGSWGTPAGWAQMTTAGRKALYQILDIQNTDNPTTATLLPFNYTGYDYYVRRIVRKRDGSCVINSGAASVLRLPTISTMTPVALANANDNGYTHSANNEKAGTYSSVEDHHISFEGADLIWEYDGAGGQGITSAERAGNTDASPVEGLADTSYDSRKIRLVFKLSSFGKRLRKILIGLGYDINLDNDDNVSILPLIGYYKAWWDTFAPERYKNFYETNAWKIIQASMAGSQAADIVTMMNQVGQSDMRDYFRGFMADLGVCFATEKMDVISAATDKFNGQSNTQTGNNVGAQTEIQKSIIAQINEVINSPTSGAVNADGSQASEFTEGSGNNDTNPIAYSIANYLNKNMSAIKLTQPQVNALKAGYIMMNKTSVAGQCVESILKYLGFGDYVEECKGKFITQDEGTIKISDVIATAATDKASLGQYGGRGMGLCEFNFSYSTNRHGYIYVLSCIVPESGYINSPAHENEAINFEKMYNMQLDGISYEAIQKKCIMGSPLINDKTYRYTFGFLPTYTQWKFTNNKANGDFSLNSRKTYMTPYTLDKMIPIADANVYRVEEAQGHTESIAELCAPPFKYEDTPNAGEDYRYINKFPWNGNYNRIFEAGGDGLEWSVYSPNNNAFLYLSYEYDNFMCHNVFEIDYIAKMKSIEDSYNTYDEEHEAPDTKMKHA